MPERTQDPFYAKSDETQGNRPLWSDGKTREELELEIETRPEMQPGSDEGVSLCLDAVKRHIERVGR